MNKLILCEGETDAILLSYYLGRTCGWRYVKNSPAGVKFRQTRPVGSRSTGTSETEIIC